MSKTEELDFGEGRTMCSGKKNGLLTYVKFKNSEARNRTENMGSGNTIDRGLDFLPTASSL